MSPDPDASVTDLLLPPPTGGRRAIDRLIPVVYDHSMARAWPELSRRE
jgi:hypothetical protein